MDTQLVNHLLLLRAAIAHLGERSEPRWWSSAFCGTNGIAFLSPAFPRTSVHAQLNGVSSAAARVHDDRIGLGNVFHVFRLPEDLEQGIHGMSAGNQGPQLAEILRSPDAAMQFLKRFVRVIQRDEQGPVRVGQLSALREISSWGDVAALYLRAFETGKEAFPFFSDRT